MILTCLIMFYQCKKWGCELCTGSFTWDGFIPLIKFNRPRLIWINNNKFVFDKMLVLGIPRHEGKIVGEIFSKDSVMKKGCRPGDQYKFFFNK